MLINFIKKFVRKWCKRKWVTVLLQKTSKEVAARKSAKFGHSLKHATKSTWTTHDMRNTARSGCNIKLCCYQWKWDKIFVEAFETNQEEDHNFDRNLLELLTNISHQKLYVRSSNGCSLVHIIWIEIEQHKWKWWLKWLLKSSLKIWNPTDKYSTISETQILAFTQDWKLH